MHSHKYFFSTSSKGYRSYRSSQRGSLTSVVFLLLTDSPAVAEDDEDHSEDNDSSLHVPNKVSTHVPPVDGICLIGCGGAIVTLAAQNSRLYFVKISSEELAELVGFPTSFRLSCVCHAALPAFSDQGPGERRSDASSWDNRSLC